MDVTGTSIVVTILLAELIQKAYGVALWGLSLVVLVGSSLRGVILSVLLLELQLAGPLVVQETKLLKRVKLTGDKLQLMEQSMVL
jgi:hypothetical protein